MGKGSGSGLQGLAGSWGRPLGGRAPPAPALTCEHSRVALPALRLGPHLHGEAVTRHLGQDVGPRQQLVPAAGEVQGGQRPPRLPGPGAAASGVRLFPRVLGAPRPPAPRPRPPRREPGGGPQPAALALQGRARGGPRRAQGPRGQQQHQRPGAPHAPDGRARRCSGRGGWRGAQGHAAQGPLQSPPLRIAPRGRGGGAPLGLQPGSRAARLPGVKPGPARPSPGCASTCQALRRRSGDALGARCSGREVPGEGREEGEG